MLNAARGAPAYDGILSCVRRPSFCEYGQSGELVCAVHGVKAEAGSETPSLSIHYAFLPAARSRVRAAARLKITI